MFHRWLFILLFFAQTVTGFSQVHSLDFYIREGLTNSPLLKDLSNQVRSNALDCLIIKATQRPQVNFNGLLSYAPVVNGFGYSEAITNGGNFVSVVNVSQPLFNKKSIKAITFHSVLNWNHLNYS